MSSMFANPSTPGDGIKWADHLGHLLLIDVLEEVAEIKTSFGDTTAIRANVTVLDGGDGTYDDTLIFPKVLQSQLRRSVGAKVLGRLSQGTAKPGQSAPWMLQAASEEDTAKAEAWVRANQPATTAPASAAPF